MPLSGPMLTLLADDLFMPRASSILVWHPLGKWELYFMNHIYGARLNWVNYQWIRRMSEWLDTLIEREVIFAVIEENWPTSLYKNICIIIACMSSLHAILVKCFPLPSQWQHCLGIFSLIVHSSMRNNLISHLPFRLGLWSLMREMR